MAIQFERALTAEEKNELAGLAAEGAMIAGITGETSPAAQVTRLRDFLESEEIDEDQHTDYAYKFGSLYGSLVEMALGWTWGKIVFEDGETRFAVLSPNRDHGIAVHELFYNHLAGTKPLNIVALLTKLPKEPKPRAAAQGVLLFN